MSTLKPEKAIRLPETFDHTAFSLEEGRAASAWPGRYRSQYHRQLGRCRWSLPSK